MFEKEEWALHTARAEVTRWKGAVLVSMRGMVTAAAYELLHMRLAGERRSTEVWLVLDWPALIACTNQSAVEAATRVTPAEYVRRPRAPVTLLVPPARLQWAERHAALMSAHGISRSALPLRPMAPPAQERQAALAA